MNKRKLMASFVAAIFVATFATLGANPMINSDKELVFAQSTDESMHSNATESSLGMIVRDSVAVPLQDLTIPANGFIHFYDTTPYVINNGHVAANIPCGEDSAAGLNVLIGQAPNLTGADLEYISELSNPGQLCLYHVDLKSMANQSITDVALQNPGAEDVELPPGSSVVIGVNSISSNPEHAEEESGDHGNETAVAVP
ncbi:MAG: hypothetical protein ACRD5J_15640 [Nitrososphaeraceae archaeon]